MDNTIIVPAVSTLEQAETLIQGSLDTARNGIAFALRAVRDGKLYREAKNSDGTRTYNTFEEYCLNRWGFTKQRAYQILDSLAVVDELEKSTIVDFLPRSEAQTRELAKVPQGERAEVWNAAVADARNAQPTAKAIANTRARIFAEPEPDGTDPFDEKTRLFPGGRLPVPKNPIVLADSPASLFPPVTWQGHAKIIAKCYVQGKGETSVCYQIRQKLGDVPGVPRFDLDVYYGYDPIDKLFDSQHCLAYDLRSFENAEELAKTELAKLCDKENKGAYRFKTWVDMTGREVTE